MISAPRILLSEQTFRRSKTSPQNLLLIKASGCRADSFSTSAKINLRTPNLDALAKNGVLFNNVQAAYPDKGPAAACLFTGKASHQTGMRTQKQKYAQEESGILQSTPTIDEQLKQNGYVCYFYGDWELPLFKSRCYRNFDFQKPSAESSYFVTQETLDYNCMLSDSVPARYLKTGEMRDPRTRLPYTMNPLDRRYGLAPNQALVGHEGLAPIHSGDCHGVSSLAPEKTRTAFTAQRVIDTIKKSRHSAPFSISCSFDTLLPPLLPCRYWATRHLENQAKLPESINDSMHHSPYSYAIRMKRGIAKYPEYSNHQKLEYLLFGYNSKLEELDHWIGQIVNSLKSEGLYEDTLIVFTSDHGQLLGEHGLYGNRTFYSPCLEVPLILSNATLFRRYLVSDYRCSTRDIASTILSALSIPNIAHNQLWQIATGKPLSSSHTNPIAFSEYDYGQSSYHRDSPNFYLRNDQYAWMTSAFRSAPFPDGLYAINSDPDEITNLIAKPNVGDEASHALDTFRNKLIDRLIAEQHPYASFVAEKLST